MAEIEVTQSDDGFHVLVRESILCRSDLSVIERYFPRYRDEIRRRFS